MNNDLYRKRLKKPMDKKVLEFLSSLEDDRWILEEDIIGTQVHNIMLFEQGIIEENDVKNILTSLEKLKEKISKNEFKLDENFEDIHPLIEKYVINDIGIEMGGKIHTGRSRNDQVSVDIRLKVRSSFNLLSQWLLDLAHNIMEISKKSIDCHMPLYTHFQKGQLGVISHYFNNYIAQILRSLQRIEENYNRINLNPLGACAIGGTSIDVNRERTAELLGFNGIVENSIDAISSRDYILESLSVLSIIAIQFSRIAEDLLVWSTKEFNFVELDDQFCSVSSVMPQKRNPDSLELTRAKTSKVVTNLTTGLLITKGIPSGYFRDFQELKMPLKESFELIFSIVEIFMGIFSSLKINKEKMEISVRNSYIFALDLAEILVQDYDIPFRQSHEIVADLVKSSKTPEEAFSKKNIEETTLKILKKEITLSTKFEELLKDPSKCLNKRISQGSPSKNEILKTLDNLNALKDEIKDQLEKRLEKEEIAKQKREKKIKELIS